MLKKENRLRTRYEFYKVRRFGKKFENPLFNLFVLDAKGYSGSSRIGIVVSNKLEKRAVKRNRIKRVFREVIRLNFDKIQSGYWIVVYPKKEALEKNYEEINTEFNKVIQEVFISR